jgi:hypothetical protein
VPKDNKDNKNVSTITTLPVFGAAVVRLLQKGMVAYPSKFGNGGKSCRMLEVDVPILSAGISITAPIYANFNPTEDGHQIVFSASMPRGVFATDADEVARDGFLAHAEYAAAALPQWPELQARAEALLLGQKPVTTVARPKLARLIGKSGETLAETPMQPTA